MKSWKAHIRPARAAADAAFLFIQPGAVFNRLQEEASPARDIFPILFWGATAGALDAVLTLAGIYPASDSSAALGVVLCPLLFLAATALLTLPYHLMVLAAGGAGGLKKSARILAALSPLLFLELHLGNAPFVRLPLILFRMHLMFRAAEQAHGMRRPRSVYVFGPVYGIVLLFLVRTWIAG